MSDNTHIALALHDRHGTYWPYVAVTVTSVCQHTSVPMVVHLLHDETLNHEAQHVLGQIVLRFGHRLALHAVSITQFLSGLDFRHLSVAKFCITQERSNPLSGKFSPADVCFWGYTQHIPDISRFVGRPMSFLQRIHTGQSHAHIIPSEERLSPSP